MVGYSNNIIRRMDVGGNCPYQHKMRVVQAMHYQWFVRFFCLYFVIWDNLQSGNYDTNEFMIQYIINPYVFKNRLFIFRLYM